MISAGLKGPGLRGGNNPYKQMMMLIDGISANGFCPCSDYVHGVSIAMNQYCCLIRTFSPLFQRAAKARNFWISCSKSGSVAILLGAFVGQ